jgi:hypothetical protein
LKGFPFAKIVYAHFAIIMQFLKLLFSFWYSFYFWFKQFEGNSNRNLAISQLLLGDVLNKT